MSKHPAYGRGSRAKKCRECGRPDTEAGRMSARALCADCSADRNGQQKDQLREKSGPYYDEWRRGMIDLARQLARD